MYYPLINNSKQSNAAFSLMEVMVVIAIIGILSAVAIPNMIAWRATAQYSAAVRMVKSAIDETRMKAIKSNMPARVDFVVGNRTFNTLEWDIAANAYAAPVSHQLPVGTIISASTFGGAQLEFNSRGMANNVGSVTIQDSNGRNSNIVVNIVGTSRIQ